MDEAVMQDQKLDKARKSWGSDADEYRGPARLEELRLEQLVEAAANPRKRFPEESMRELTDSVREKGVVTPLLVRPVGVRDGLACYEIAAGHRRALAAKRAGRLTVPAIIRGMADEEFLELLVMENDQREDIHALEEAQGYQSLLQLPGYDVGRIAARVGRSPKYVYDRLKLLQLIPEAQELFLRDLFSAGHAILLARLKPADQMRAITVEDAGSHDRNLFQEMYASLFDDDDLDEAAAKKDPYAMMKAVSVREFEAWIQHNVRFDAEQADPVLFPETAAALEEHAEDRHGVILITRQHLASSDVRGAGKERVFGAPAWKRADGELWTCTADYPSKEQPSKTCAHSRLALVACGPGQGESFLVCIAKEKCAVHWSAWQKDRKKRQAAAAGGGGESQQARAAREEKQRAEFERKEQEAQKRWKAATPALVEALAAKIKAAPATATGPLGKMLLVRGGARGKFGTLVPPGKTAEDLVRHLAFMQASERADSTWDWGRKEFRKELEAFGINVDAILNREAPAVQTSAPKKPTRGTCRKCGCTEEKACGGGCGWADSSETRCTACFPPKLSSAAKKGKKKARRGADR